MTLKAALLDFLWPQIQLNNQWNPFRLLFMKCTALNQRLLWIVNCYCHLGIKYQFMKTSLL